MKTDDSQAFAQHPEGVGGARVATTMLAHIETLEGPAQEYAGR